MAAATVNLFIMEAITEIIICYTTAIFMMLIIVCYRQDLHLRQQPQYFNEAPRLRKLTRECCNWLAVSDKFASCR